MIPSDHFVRFYSEVFKAVNARDTKCLVGYWRELGRMQIEELGELFREGGIQAAIKYWKRIYIEENCQGMIKDHGDWLEFRMDKCPSLTKVLDNDAAPFEFYCDHCMGWVEPVMKFSGLHAVMDMESRSEPHCRFAVFKDKAKALEFERTAKLSSHPYTEARQRMAKAAGKKRKTAERAGK